MLIIAGGIRLKDPSDLNEFVADARRSIAAARASDGNITFTCMVDDAVAGDAFMFERWRDESALQAYLARPEVAALFTKWGHRIENAVRKFDASNERSPRDYPSVAE
jgi:quinol monooxygenase YgiN